MLVIETYLLAMSVGPNISSITRFRKAISPGNHGGVDQIELVKLEKSMLVWELGFIQRRSDVRGPRSGR